MGEKPIIQLTPRMILEKEFKTSLKGYNQDEVDKFLDKIIKDYEQFQKKIEALELENAKLKKEAEKATENRPTQAVGNTNYDILQRLSNLEKHVFGNKLFD